jgi:polyhydroxybutyrate depolymerase
MIERCKSWLLTFVLAGIGSAALALEPGLNTVSVQHAGLERRALVEEIARRHAIDRKRVFATGMSNGGMMAYRLACEAGDLVRAIAAVAGTESFAMALDCQPALPVSVLHIHARDDAHVPYDGGIGPDARRGASRIDYVSVPDTVQRWVGRLACRREAEPLRQDAGVRCEVHRGCRGGERVQLCSTTSGGHSWPGADRGRRGKEAPSDALDASAEIWRFFAATPPR